MNDRLSRRRFLAATSAGAAAASAAHTNADASRVTDSKPAVLGGKPIRSAPFPSWPKIDASDERAWMDVLRSGKWFRGSGRTVERFEQAYAGMTGARGCLATANGTSALYTSLNALGVAPGDEVIVPPYTFVATVNVVLMQHALPVFVDTDIETFQIDARKIEAAITGRTTAIIPVHLGGAAADLDAILEIGRKRKIPVLEDACQAHLGEWRGRKVGSLGAAGCFSFQASKNLNSGEGGAILSNDAEFIERAYTFHNNGRGRKGSSSGFAYSANGANLRMTEFQAALLMTQMARLAEQSEARDRNARYLSGLLREIPGISPARMYPGCTRNAWHLYMFRYNKTRFEDLPRAKFLNALEKEGIPCSDGYRPLNREPFLKEVLSSRIYQSLYGPERLARWATENRCPANDRLCDEAVWLSQTMLLGATADMDQIAEAVRKVQRFAGEIARR